MTRMNEHHLLVHSRYNWVGETYQLSSLLATNRQGIVSLIPLPERSSVNDNNSVLDQSLRSHQLIVGGIVHYINNTGLACATWNISMFKYHSQHWR